MLFTQTGVHCSNNSALLVKPISWTIATNT